MTATVDGTAPRRGVLVTGMHRSGTSAVTRAAARAGLVAVGEGAEDHDVSNPHGHWESSALTSWNDAILERLGGWWDAPAQAEPRWAQRADVRALEGGASAALATTVPSHEAWVWKDPRTSLTLPFWRNVAGDVPLVIVHRDPIAVAASLTRRNGLTTMLGLALWARYVRSVLEGARGLPVLVVSWDDAHDRPRELAAALRGWIADRVGVAHAELDDIAGAIDGSLGGPTAESAALPAEVAALAAVMRDLRGAHVELPDLALPSPDPVLGAIVEERRLAEHRRRSDLAAQAAAVRARMPSQRMRRLPGRLRRLLERGQPD